MLYIELQVPFKTLSMSAYVKHFVWNFSLYQSTPFTPYELSILKNYHFIESGVKTFLRELFFYEYN